MNCKKCGFVLEPNAAFCPNCGMPVANQDGTVTQVPEQPVAENAQEPVQLVSAPIMPDAPEAPLPGTQAIPVVDQTTGSPVNLVQPIDQGTQNIETSQAVQSPNQVSSVSVQPQVQGAPTVDPTQKNKKKVSPIVLILLVVLFICAIASIFILLSGSNMLGGNKKSTTSSTTSTTTSTTRPLVKEEIILNGVKIFVPFGFTIDPLSTQELGIINNASKQTQININPLPEQRFDYYDANFESLPNLFAEQGVAVVSSERKMVGDRTFLSFIVNVNGVEELLCYTNIRDDSVIRFELVQAGMSVDDALNVFIDIAEFAVPQAEIPVE